MKTCNINTTMIKYYKEYTDDIIIAYYEVDIPADKVIKKISQITGYDFEQTKEDIYSDLNDFTHDTLIIKSSIFIEDIMNIMDYGVLIYITDY